MTAEAAAVSAIKNCKRKLSRARMHDAARRGKNKEAEDAHSEKSREGKTCQRN